MKHLTRYTIIILSSMFFLNLFSKCKNSSDITMSGGHTESREICVPIKSTNLKSLDTYFYISPLAYNGMFEGSYTIKLQPAENGKYTLSCDNETITIEADEVKGIQEIIKRYDLESLNGLTSITAGLPPECQPMSFKAVYASNEKISFRVNNNSSAEWQISMFRYVRSLLLAHGNTKYAVDKETTKITRLILEYSNGDGVVHKYGNIEIDGKTKLYRKTYDRVAKKTLVDDIVDIPANHYEGLSTIVDSLGLQWLMNNFVPNNEPDPTKSRYIHIYVDKDFDPLFSSTYIDNRITEEVQAMANCIQEYVDKPFK